MTIHHAITMVKWISKIYEKYAEIMHWIIAIYCECVVAINWIVTIYNVCAEVIHFFVLIKRENLSDAIRNNNSKAVNAWLSEDKWCKAEFQAAIGRSAQDGELEMITKILCYDDGTAEWLRIKNYALKPSAANNRVDIMLKLLECGADIHFNEDVALCASAQQGHFEMMVTLLEHGANIHARDDEALFLSIEANHPDIVTALLECGADVHARNDAALLCGVQSKQPDIVTALLEHGADPCGRNDYIFLYSFWFEHLKIPPYDERSLALCGGVMSPNDECALIHLVHIMTHVELTIIAVLLEYGGNLGCYNKIILKKVQHEFNKELAVIIFPYCASDDYQYFPNWFVKEMIVSTKGANKN